MLCCIVMHWGGSDFSLSKGGLKVNSPVLWMVLSFSFILSFPFLMVVCVHMPPPIHTVCTYCSVLSQPKARGSKKPCNDTCPMEGDHTVRRKICKHLGIVGAMLPLLNCFALGAVKQHFKPLRSFISTQHHR